MQISPDRIASALAAVAQLKAELVGEDDTLLRDTIEGETDIFELLDRLAEQAIGDARMAEIGRDRCSRIEARSDRARTVINRILQALELTEKLERPLSDAETRGWV